MRVPSNVRSGSLGFNMTPMIDVVFLLIIFFLVSSHLAKQEAQMPLPLPTAESGKKSLDEDAPRLTINVTAEGVPVAVGAPYSAGRANSAADATDLRGRLGLQVRIRGDRNVPYKHVEPIMLACTRAGIWDVSFSVYRPEDVR